MNYRAALKLKHLNSIKAMICCLLLWLAGWLLFVLSLKYLPRAWLNVPLPPSPLKLPWLPLLLALPCWLAAGYCYLLLSWRQYRSQSLLHRIQHRQALSQLSWQQFEILTAEWYRHQGFRVTECGGGGADGGIDLRLYKKNQLSLVQCKHWSGRVGVKPVRELYGLMVAEGAVAAILVASSDFSAEAKRFALDKPLQLINGEMLLDKLNRL